MRKRIPLNDPELDPKYKPHRFDTEIAALYGINAALVYGHIQWRCDHAKKRFVTVSLKHLCTRYSYLGRKQVWNALHVLAHPGRKLPALLDRQREPGGFSYSPRCDENKNAIKHSFDKNIAEQVGVVPAIIYANLHYWIKTNWDLSIEEVLKKIKPADFDDDWQKIDLYAFSQTTPAAIRWNRIDDWIEKHPYIAARTAERGFKTLVDKNLLKVSYVEGKLPVWSLPKKSMHEIITNYLQRMGLLDSASDWSAKTEQLKTGQNDDVLEELSAKRETFAPKGNNPRQNEISRAKTEQESEFRSMVPAVLAPLRSHVDEAVVVEDLVDETSALFRPASKLASARSDAASETDAIELTPPVGGKVRSEGFLLKSECRELSKKMEPETRKEIAKLSEPNLPVFKKKVRKDDFGNIIKRRYTRRKNVYDYQSDGVEDE